MLLTITLIIFAYLLGSISSAILVCRLMGLPDPRTTGSRNPGTTNVLRLGSKPAAVITLLGDMLKGLLPMLLAQFLEAEPMALAGAGLAAFLGHLYPVFFHFQGGKGVATALGVFLGYAWLVGLAIIATWLLVALLSRISSLSALTAFLLAPLYVWWLAPSLEMILAAVIITLMLLWRHHDNIRKIIAGTESKMGVKAQ